MIVNALNIYSKSYVVQRKWNNMFQFPFYTKPKSWNTTISNQVFSQYLNQKKFDTNINFREKLNFLSKVIIYLNYNLT